MSKYRVLFEHKAVKDLARLPRDVQVCIRDAIDVLQDNPRPPGVKKLEGSTDLYRIPVGDYRVLYRIEDDVLVILIIRIGHRKDIYR